MVLDKAKELGELIAVSDEMERMKKAEAALEGDDTAKALMETFKEKQIEVVRAVKTGASRDVLERLKAELQLEHANLVDNDTAYEYMEAKSDFDSLMKQVNDVMIYAISGEEPCSPNKCGTCGGGCH